MHLTNQQQRILDFAADIKQREERNIRSDEAARGLGIPHADLLHDVLTMQRRGIFDGDGKPGFGKDASVAMFITPDGWRAVRTSLRGSTAPLSDSGI